MRVLIIVFGILGFLLSLFYSFMTVALDIAETIPICDDCTWTPWWDYITVKDSISIVVVTLICGLLGGLFGYLICKLVKLIKR